MSRNAILRLSFFEACYIKMVQGNWNPDVLNNDDPYKKGLLQDGLLLRPAFFAFHLAIRWDVP